MKVLLSLLLALVAPLAAFADTDSDYSARIDALNKNLESKRTEGKDSFYHYLEEQGRVLLRDFPDKPDSYAMLLAAAQNTDPKHAEEILAELEKAKSGHEVAGEIAAVRQKLKIMGQPLELKFTAADGRAVDLAELKGKVVLVDFWATWCGPCVAELPNVKAAYEKLHPKGFEIVGISLDQEKDTLLEFTKAKEMPWPQYFDGGGFENKMAQKFGISQIPTMWLVDKTGKLVDTEGRDDLEKKIEDLLAK